MFVIVKYNILSLLYENENIMKKTIKDFCKKYNLTESQFFGKEKVGGDLYLQSVTSLPDGFNPTVGGYLDLGSVTSLPDGFNPTVGGDLDLGSVTSLPDGFNPTVGGNLYLQSVTSLPDGFNPTVGGYLYLGSVTSLPDGFNPTVGGNLYLGSVTSLPDGFNPTVGGNLYLGSGYKESTNKPKGAINTPKNRLLFWQDGKYVSADGIFTEVINKRGNIYRVKKLNSNKEFYLVSDGKNHSHGDTLRKAKEDFQFKLIAEKIKKEPITKDTEFTVKYYRMLTGACDFGCRSWMKDNNIPFKVVDEQTVELKPIKAPQLLKLLQKTNAYGLEKFKQLIDF